ncbi:MAG: hypothetical protein KDJ54_14705 [Candidatus Competibacteraceae bacterium]|nr:hypothetical protein [Candidatus Competibacteraceae bacterium]
MTQRNTHLILQCNIPGECYLRILLWWFFAGSNHRPGIFYCNRKKTLDALQQNHLTCNWHREMSFFSTPSFGGYLPEPTSSGFFYACDPDWHEAILAQTGNFPGAGVP